VPHVIQPQNTVQGLGAIQFAHRSPTQGSAGDSPGVSQELNHWQAERDPRLFKLILSPEFGERLDLRQFTREFMARLEARIGAPLQWVAVVHNNTEHPHVHVALRGTADGQELRLDKKLIRSGMREAQRLDHRSPASVRWHKYPEHSVAAHLQSFST